MRQSERDEMMIRMDERIKTVFNNMDTMEDLFTNHLHHHEVWETDLKSTMKWWMGVMLTMCAAAMGYVRIM